MCEVVPGGSSGINAEYGVDEATLERGYVPGCHVSGTIVALGPRVPTRAPPTPTPAPGPAPTASTPPPPSAAAPQTPQAAPPTTAAPAPATASATATAASSSTTTTIGNSVLQQQQRLGTLEFAVGDDVVCVLPLCDGGGLAEYVSAPWYNLAHKPAAVSHEEAATGAPGALLAYTAFYLKFKAAPGEFLLLISASSPAGYIALQVASLLKLHVIAAVETPDQANFIHDLPTTNIDRVVNMSEESIEEVVAQETGGLGVDYVLDLSATITATTPTATLTRCLAAQGHWATTCPSSCTSLFQLDPPEARILHMKGASVSFLFEPVWNLSPSKHGVFHHIMEDVLEKMSGGTLLTKVAATYPLEKVREAFRIAQQGCAVVVAASSS
eukprot:TRINITY_DN1022_c0_g2_i1.p1 TRINITY_DN1022_c0_g2~~TRINITY_DN1022_c0_g2_i1.p1  ORF type:complete len:384 (-),score=131.52 TRINITY_DN1022_c0_g2_i1:93-1244(-)